MKSPEHASKRINFQYCVNGHINVAYDCANNGCAEEGICRCGEIVDYDIYDIDVNSCVQAIQENLELSKKDKMLIYGIGRIFRILGLYDPTLYTWNASNSYYGEEIDSVYLDSAKEKNLIQTIKQFVKTSDKMGFLMKMEYGDIPSEHENKDFHIIEIPLSYIHPGNPNHSDKIKNEKNPYEDYSVDILGVVKMINPTTYRLVDGYHRYAAEIGKTKHKKRFKVILWDI